MTDFVVAHGAWSAGWAWKKMRPLMAERGHVLWTPTYTGLGERAHLGTPETSLETHIQDVVAHIEIEDIAGLVLLGHSYGGMVATGVADRVPERIVRIIYLDAVVPRDGQTAAELLGGIEGVKATAVDGWRIPPRDLPPDTPEADRAWAAPRRLPQPIRTLDTPIRLTRGEPAMPRHYIYCSRTDPRDLTRPFYERARTEPGWTAHEIDASHNPHITAPGALAGMLDDISQS